MQTGKWQKQQNRHPNLAALKARFPVLLSKCLLEFGDTVKMGDKLLILEAMKMENKIEADKQGTIKDIKVRPGDTVMEGDILLEIGE